MRPLRALVAVALAASAWGVSAPPAAASNDPGSTDQWALKRVGAEAAWKAGRGAGQVIAVIDSGVDLGHEDLAGKLVPGWDFVEDDDDPQDGYGHGTHVAGIAAAASGNGIGVAGVAPDAKIMPVRVLDGDGRGTLADVIDGIRWAVDHGATVINLSVGGTGQAVLGPGFDDAVREAWDRGVVCVVAAGNDYVLSSGFADEPALVVAATTATDGKPDYSSGVGRARWGLAAPGGAGRLVSSAEDRLEEDVLSTWFDPVTGPNQYATMAGTSMASPHVAGAVAILRGLGLPPAEAVDRLLTTATDIGPSGADATFGAGRLDLAKAVGGSATPTPAQAPDPTPAVTSPVGAGAAAAGTSEGTVAAPPSTAEAPPGSSAPAAPGTSAPTGDGTSTSSTATTGAAGTASGTGAGADDGGDGTASGPLGDDGTGDDDVPAGWALLAAALALAAGAAHAPALSRRRS